VPDGVTTGQAGLAASISGVSLAGPSISGPSIPNSPGTATLALTSADAPTGAATASRTGNAAPNDTASTAKGAGFDALASAAPDAGARIVTTLGGAGSGGAAGDIGSRDGIDATDAARAALPGMRQPLAGIVPGAGGGSSPAGALPSFMGSSNSGLASWSAGGSDTSGSGTASAPGAASGPGAAGGSDAASVPRFLGEGSDPNAGVNPGASGPDGSPSLAVSARLGVAFPAAGSLEGAGPPAVGAGADATLAATLAPLSGSQGGATALAQLDGAGERRSHAPPGAGGIDAGNADAAVSGLLNGMGGADAAGAPTLKLSSRLDSSSLPQELAGHVGYLIGNNLGSARLQVTPADLGPIELQVSVQGGTAQVVMSAHSALTRQALESSAPQLRELLGSQGFTQVSVDISQRSFQQESGFTPPTPSVMHEPAAARSAMPGAAPGGVVSARSVSSLLDAYA
jgi:flagellar hook-length control protein FliK